MLIEIEQEYMSKPINYILEFVLSLDYEGYFLEGDRLTEIAKFSYEKKQKPYLSNIDDRHYINNFIFIPRNHKNNF